MEKLEPVKSEVESDRIVVACAYVGHEHETLKAALPAGFKARQYVAKFVEGRLVAVEAGKPEDVISRMLGTPATTATQECKSCTDSQCKDCAPTPSQ